MVTPCNDLHKDIGESKPAIGSLFQQVNLFLLITEYLVIYPRIFLVFIEETSGLRWEAFADGMRFVDVKNVYIGKRIGKHCQNFGCMRSSNGKEDLDNIALFLLDSSVNFSYYFLKFFYFKILKEKLPCNWELIISF